MRQVWGRLRLSLFPSCKKEPFMMPVFKPKGAKTLTNKQYAAMRKRQKAGLLEMVDVTTYPRAFSYVKGDDDQSSIMLGYELETLIKEEGEQYSKSTKAAQLASSKYGQLCNFRDEYYATFELVSVPATLNFHRKAIDQLLDMQGFTSKGSNGMHVHISKKSFKSKEHLAKFIVFVNLPINREFMRGFAGRAMGNWCRPNPNLNIKYMASDKRQPTKVYIQWDEGLGSNLLTMDMKHGGGKDNAINTEPQHTVELRIFLAPTNKHKLISNLEFTHAVVKFSEAVEIHELTVSCFADFVSRQKKDYPYLYIDMKPYMPKAKEVKKEPAVKLSRTSSDEKSVAIGSARQLTFMV